MLADQSAFHTRRSPAIYWQTSGRIARKHNACTVRDWRQTDRRRTTPSLNASC